MRKLVLIKLNDIFQFRENHSLIRLNDIIRRILYFYLFIKNVIIHFIFFINNISYKRIYLLDYYTKKTVGYFYKKYYIYFNTYLCVSIIS